VSEFAYDGSKETFMIRQSMILSLGFCASLSILGCGSSGDDGPKGSADASTDPGPVLECPRHTIAGSDKYVDGLSKTGDSGVMKVTFKSASPLPPARGHDVWTIQVTDMSDQPIDGATIDFDKTPFMPCHNHATSVFPTATAAGTPGTYTIDPVYFVMTGIWTVRFKIKAPDARADEVVFEFVIPR
jgi:hypothetical protein